MKKWMRIAGTIALSVLTIFGTNACGGGGGDFTGNFTTEKAPFEMEFDLQARAMSTTRILLTWEAPESGTDYFEIEGSDDGVDYHALSTVSGDLRFFSDITVSRAQTRHYRIRAFDGTSFSIYSATAAGTTDDVAIAVGAQHSLALAADGTVWAWGKNHYGQLGDGTQSDHEPRIYPQPVIRETGAPLDKIVAISTSWNTNFAVAEDGTVWAWGMNAVMTISSNWGQNGYLGNGTTVEYSVFPVKVLGENGLPLENIVSVSTTANFSIALSAEGTVYTWGQILSMDHQYELNAVLNAVQVMRNDEDPLQEIVSITCTGSSRLAISSNGTVWGWGSNHGGELGQPSSDSWIIQWPVPESAAPETYSWIQLQPMQMRKDGGELLENIVSISSGLDHILALSVDGKVFACGSNEAGQLGDETLHGMNIFLAIPVMLAPDTPLENIVSIDAGMTSSAAIAEDGTAYFWGAMTLPLGSNWVGGPQTLTPTELTLIGNPRRIATGYFHNMALSQDGTILAWGENHNGQLGDGHQGTGECTCHGASGKISDTPVFALTVEESIPFNLYGNHE